jgi:hypothetical protein
VCVVTPDVMRSCGAYLLGVLRCQLPDKGGRVLALEPGLFSAIRSYFNVTPEAVAEGLDPAKISTGEIVTKSYAVRPPPPPTHPRPRPRPSLGLVWRLCYALVAMWTASVSSGVPVR